MLAEFLNSCKRVISVRDFRLNGAIELYLDLNGIARGMPYVIPPTKGAIPRLPHEGEASK